MFLLYNDLKISPRAFSVFIVRSFFLLIFLYTMPCSCFAGKAKDTVYQKDVGIDEYEKERAVESSFLEVTNPAKLLMVMLIRFYKTFLSKQDGSTCQFRPSCSHFGAKAIKTAGPFQGLFMTSDRLQRCNPFTYGKYPIHEDKRHHNDPVERHILWEEGKQ